MKTYSAKDAKEHFGELMDNVQREPVTIEKYGRPVAVVMSQVEFEEMKLERLRLILGEGKAQADRGEFAADSSLESLLAELDRDRAQTE
jgi:prevent-host-death family protein